MGMSQLEKVKFKKQRPEMASSSNAILTLSIDFSRIFEQMSLAMQKSSPKSRIEVAKST